MNIPQILILFRALLAPIIVSVAFLYGQMIAPLIVILMYLGLFSDIFDGIIARKLNISTTTLRRLDSIVDILFWISIAIASWLLYPELLYQNRWFISLLLCTEILCHLVSFIKFGKELATHAYLSKLWGISLLISFTVLLGYGKAGLWLYSCIILGVIAHIDCIAITLLLPKWMHDIPSTYHAYLIRKGKTIHRNALFNG